MTPDLEGLDASGVLAYMVDRFHPRLAVACSFQKEASVVLDLLLRIAPDARVFTLDTHVLFPETYETWKRVEERYGITIEVHQGPSLGRQAATHGDRLWERDPDECCRLRKVDPLQRGARRRRRLDLRRPPRAVDGARPHAQARLGRQARALEGQPARRLDRADVWRYIAEHDVPYNPLHDRGYASIGCTHCTKPGDGRDGRWAGSEKTECGLHG